MKSKIKVKNKKIDYFILGLLIFVFGYFFLFHEIRQFGDSFQYLNQFVTREPVYASVLQLLE